MEKPTVVKEIVKGDRIFKEMSDGTVCVESAENPMEQITVIMWLSMARLPKKNSHEQRLK